MDKIKISSPKKMKCEYGYIHMIETAGKDILK